MYSFKYKVWLNKIVFVQMRIKTEQKNHDIFKEHSCYYDSLCPYVGSAVHSISLFLYLRNSVSPSFYLCLYCDYEYACIVYPVQAPVMFLNRKTFYS